MKSYFLENISSLVEGERELSRQLPGQSNPWVLLSESGDPIAYFNLVKSDREIKVPAISVDISGRHYDSDELIMNILAKLQRNIGGDVTNDA